MVSGSVVVVTFQSSDEVLEGPFYGVDLMSVLGVTFSWVCSVILFRSFVII